MNGGARRGAADNGEVELPAPVGPRGSAIDVISALALALLVLLVLLLVASDVVYLRNHRLGLGEVLSALSAPDVRGAIRRSAYTSLTALALILLFAVPAGYALSRRRFPGRSIANALVDAPIVLPPVVVGVSLLAFFAGPFGRPLKTALAAAGLSMTSAAGIVLCQFILAVPYAVRAAQAAFDSVDRRLEQAALCLGCSPSQAFRRVTLPLSANGLFAGAVMAWARAIGVFGPLMVFVGTSPRVQVMPTMIWLELSVGNIETSLAIALVMLLMAGASLAVVHRLAPGRSWS